MIQAHLVFSPSSSTEGAVLVVNPMQRGAEASRSLQVFLVTLEEQVFPVSGVN